MGPGRYVLDVKGVFSATISKNKKIYVVKNLSTRHLGRHAIEMLNLITNLDNITECLWQEKYPVLFTGLGELEEEYSIKFTTQCKTIFCKCSKTDPYIIEIESLILFIKPRKSYPGWRSSTSSRRLRDPATGVLGWFQFLSLTTQWEFVLIWQN